MPGLLVSAAHWLGRSSVSHDAHDFLSSSVVVAPAAESLHILSVAVIAGCAGAINLNLLGLAARDQQPAAMIRRFSPIIWVALSVMLVTGGLLVLNRPTRYFLNWSFQTKVVLILVSCAITLGYQLAAWRRPEGWATPPAAARPIAAAALAVWLCVIFAGRWIAYAR